MVSCALCMGIGQKHEASTQSFQHEQCAQTSNNILQNRCHFHLHSLLDSLPRRSNLWGRFNWHLVPHQGWPALRGSASVLREHLRTVDWLRSGVAVHKSTGAALQRLQYLRLHYWSIIGRRQWSSQELFHIFGTPTFKT